MLTRRAVAIALQRTQISNHHVVHLKLTGCCLSLIPQFKKNRRAACPGCFRMVPFSLPWLDAQGGYSGIYCGNLVELLEVNLTALGPPRLGPLGICNSQSCRQWAASSVTVQDFLPGAGVCGSSLGISALGDCYFLCSPVGLSGLGQPCAPLLQTQEEWLLSESVQLCHCCEDGVVTSKPLT